MTNLDKAFERAWEEWCASPLDDDLPEVSRQVAYRFFVRGWNERYDHNLIRIAEED